MYLCIYIYIYISEPICWFFFLSVIPLLSGRGLYLHLYHNKQEAYRETGATLKDDPSVGKCIPLAVSVMRWAFVTVHINCSITIVWRIRNICRRNHIHNACTYWFIIVVYAYVSSQTFTTVYLITACRCMYGAHISNIQPGIAIPDQFLNLWVWDWKTPIPRSLDSIPGLR